MVAIQQAFSPSLFIYLFFLLTKAMVNFVAAVVLLFVDSGAENWHDANKQTYSYLPEQVT